MPNPKTQKPGRPHLRRDSQQWIFDYIIQQTGAVFHWWSDGQHPMPKDIRSHAMISKHLGKDGQKIEAEAIKALEAGNKDEALKLYRDATKQFAHGQHTVFENNAEKKLLHASMRRCYNKVRELSSYKIELLEIPWEGKTVSGYLHLCPGLDKGPLIFFLPGCDATAEVMPSVATIKLIHDLKMHLFVFDGPGQASSSLKEMWVTADNFERSASAAIDYLIERPEIDGDNVVALAGGTGGYFMPSLAAQDHRLKAVVSRSTYTDKYYLMEEDGPRWKQLWAYLTQSSTEEELDAILAKMSLKDKLKDITCPLLMAGGEYDHRDPIEEVYELFDSATCPAELWVFADQFHLMSFAAAEGIEKDSYTHMVRWARDRIDNKPLENAGEVLYIEPGAKSPYNDPFVSRKRRWYEEGH